MKLGKIIKTSAIILTTVAATSLVTPAADANHAWGHYGSSSNSTTWSTYGNQTYGTNGDTWSTYGNHSYGQNPYSGQSTTCSTYGTQTYCN